MKKKYFAVSHDGVAAGDGGLVGQVHFVAKCKFVKYDC
jgi:hypothetical protein